jgi:hypothetical protein
MRGRRLEPKIGGHVAKRHPTGPQRLNEVSGGEPLQAIGLSAGTRHVTPPHVTEAPAQGQKCTSRRAIRNRCPRGPQKGAVAWTQSRNPAAPKAGKVFLPPLAP